MNKLSFSEWKELTDFSKEPLMHEEDILLEYEEYLNNLEKVEEE